ncbi:reverse transcriptase domain-containing protein [Tanacetum coccineum]
MMFPLSLTGEAKTWLAELNEGTIETWDELRTAFISRFFPPALFDRLLGDIRAFSQHENESLTDAWLRMKEMLRNAFTMFDILADKQSGRPSRSLPSNTQPNPKGHNSKAYQPPQSRNEHVNAVFTRSGKSYNPPVNPNDQQNDSGNPINFDSDDERKNRTSQAEKLINSKHQWSVRLADRSFQYPVGIAENMLVEVGKFTFRADFVILEIKEDIGTERMIFNIDSAMKHSYSNDDTCFSIDVIDEILEEDFDALLDEGDLELKPLPYNLEYVFLEEPSFLPVIISSQLSKEKKNKLISVLKKYKQAFAWKTTDIPGIYPSFCKHKIQLLDDKKPVV